MKYSDLSAKVLVIALAKVIFKRHPELKPDFEQYVEEELEKINPRKSQP